MILGRGGAGEGKGEDVGIVRVNGGSIVGRTDGEGVRDRHWPVDDRLSDLYEGVRWRDIRLKPFVRLCLKLFGGGLGAPWLEAEREDILMESSVLGLPSALVLPSGDEVMSLPTVTQLSSPSFNACPRLWLRGGGSTMIDRISLPCSSRCVINVSSDALNGSALLVTLVGGALAGGAGISGEPSLDGAKAPSRRCDGAAESEL